MPRVASFAGQRLLSIPTPKEIHRKIQKGWAGGQKAVPGHARGCNLCRGPWVKSAHSCPGCAERWASEPMCGKLRERCLEALKRDCRMSVGGVPP